MTTKKNILGKSETLCFSCVHAVPVESKGTGCPWSRDFRPVKGWDAEPTTLRLSAKAQDGSFFVRACPKFREG